MLLQLPSLKKTGHSLHPVFILNDSKIRKHAIALYIVRDPESDVNSQEKGGVDTMTFLTLKDALKMIRIGLRRQTDTGNKRRRLHLRKL